MLPEVRSVVHCRPQFGCPSHISKNKRYMEFLIQENKCNSPTKIHRSHAICKGIAHGRQK